VGVEGGQIHLVPVDADAAVGRMELEQVLGQLPLVPPQELAGLRLEGEDLVLRSAHEHHPVVDDRGRLMTLRDTRRRTSTPARASRVRRRDLIQGAVAPPVVRPPIHQPVLGLGLTRR